MCNYYPTITLLTIYLYCNSLQYIIIIILVLPYLKLQFTTMCNYYPAITLLNYLFKLQLITIYNYYPIKLFFKLKNLGCI